ncbi:MAG: ATP-binding cassette domain-containing protein [Bacteriovoracia bacterium]
MLQVSNLSKSFGDRTLLEDVTLTVGDGEKLGLVGRNGSGKSTLLKIIMGEETPDNGVINTPKGYKIGSLKQYIDFQKSTVLEECTSALGPDRSYESHLGEKYLMGLGFTQDDFSRNPNEFSGGFQLRINLVKLLLQEPDLLLLDEPTNYLDIVSLNWLSSFLKNHKNEFILITHDRGFMDKVVNSVAGIYRRGIRKVMGDTEKYYQQILEEEEIHEKTRINQEKVKKNMERFVDKFRAKARQASLAQSRQKMLDKMDTLEKLDSEKGLDFNFNYKPLAAKWPLQVENLSFGYSSDKLLFKNISFSLKNGECLGVIGANGKGKSTLLKVLAEELEASEGGINYHPSLVKGFFGQTNVMRLNQDNTVEHEVALANKQLTRQQVRSICGTVMFEGDDALKPIKILSGGEKSRVLLAKILATPNNFLLLDEPTNHLDQESVESFLQGIEEFPGTTVLVTHSESILKRLTTRIIAFRNNDVILCEGNYNYFLEKYGWDNESLKNEKNEVPVKKISHKEWKNLRAQLIKQRSADLKPLKEQTGTIEEKIDSTDKRIQQINSDLVKASQDNNAAEITKLSLELSQKENEVEQDFELLEQLLQKIENKKELWKKKLQELDESKE